jgi:HAE1 family hydrophobic/amphiphilic exporter-1
VTIRVREDQRSDMQSIGGLMVPSTRGEPVRVDNVATLERGFGPTIIQRYNRQFSMAIFADVKPGSRSTSAEADRRDGARAESAAGYAFRFSGQSKLLDETTNNMVLALALASIFIYIVLAMQFESFVQPLVIMTVLPLSVPFALLHAVDDRARAEPVVALGVPAAARDREEELDPAGGLHQRAAPAGACRCARRWCRRRRRGCGRS